MRDRRAAVWTRLNGKPRRMGLVYVTGEECRFTYDRAYLETGLPGLGIVYAPWIYGEHSIKRQRSEYFDLLPPLQALIPPRSQRNFLRQLILRYLDRLGIHPAPGFDTDWEILIRAGHGAIGHLDVFASDAEAEEWYTARPTSGWYRIEDSFGFSLKEFLTWFDDDAAPLLEILGPTPSVGGAIPKLLLSIPETGWDGRIGLPSRPGDRGRRDVVFKLEQPSAYPGIVELEALALDIHREAGLETPRYWLTQVADLPALAVERFDRDLQGVPRFTESLYSVLASGSRQITHNHSASYDAIGRAIDNPHLRILDDRAAAKEHLLLRLLLAFVTGNGDLHLENLSLLRRDGVTGFSPVYDPTPMRAYSLHDLLVVMPFGDYGDLLAGHDAPIGFTEAWQRFARHLGIRPQRWRALVDQALQATRDYGERVRSLTTPLEPNRERLAAIHQDMRRRIEAL